jgi:phosphoserine phosphatase RsbU/P
VLSRYEYGAGIGLADSSRELHEALTLACVNEGRGDRKKGGSVSSIVIHEVDSAGTSAQTIASLASSRLAVGPGTTLGELARAIDRHPTVLAVGVVDDDDRPTGLIERDELFALLGKQYGRELFGSKPVSSIVKTVRCFRADLSIMNVADALAEEMRAPRSGFYLLADASGRFAGVISTRDLLIHLSEMTRRDIALARRIQTSIVSENVDMDAGHLEVSCRSAAAKDVGGDFYVARRLSGRRTLLGVCDVSGKGIAASLITAVLGGFFDGYTGDTAMSGFVRRLNRYLHETFALEFFVTGILCSIDEETGETTICNLGHSYMIVTEPRGQFLLGSRKSNPPLGVSPEIVPVTRSFLLRDGCRFFIFTDGVVEQTDSRGEEYSLRRLWRLLECQRGAAPAEVSAAVAADLSAFRGHEPQKDDTTWIAVRWR